MHREQKKRNAGHIVAFVKNEQWTIDIFDLSKYYLENGSMKYIFAAIDVFTRKVYAEPMLYKDGVSCAGALQSIIMEHKVKPTFIISDSDAAFTGKEMGKVLDEHTINLNTMVLHDHHALGLIDNVARRLQFIFSKFFIRYKNHKWVHKLQSVITQYNNTNHSSLGGLTPNQAQDDKYIELLLKLNHAKAMYNHTVSDLKPDDEVRLLIPAKDRKLSKGSEPKWSEETYKVVKTQGGTITVMVDDVEKKFKRQNLLKVASD